MKKVYFTEDYLRFFKELAANNNRDWFEANKKRYTESVKKPFEIFIEDLIAAVSKRYKTGELKASDCIFRINKDIRFSKDKTPYKLHMSALIGKGGRKGMHESGLYIEAGPEHLNIYTGAYMPEKDKLMDIRMRIAAAPDKINKILQNKDFIEQFKEVKGERSKILPPEIKDKKHIHDLIFNKQFYLTHSDAPEKVLESGLIEHVIKVYGHADAFNDFLFA